MIKESLNCSNSKTIFFLDGPRTRCAAKRDPFKFKLSARKWYKVTKL